MNCAQLLEMYRVFCTYVYSHFDYILHLHRNTLYTFYIDDLGIFFLFDIFLVQNLASIKFRICQSSNQQYNHIQRKMLYHTHLVFFDDDTYCTLCCPYQFESYNVDNCTISHLMKWWNL